MNSSTPNTNSTRINASHNQSNVLTKIIATKTEHIRSLKQRFPEASLQPKISNRSLFEALKAPNASFIFECKKASPSKGLIRPEFNVEAIADVYVNYAAAISVLTDEQFFQGDMDYIPKVRTRVHQPILCKDFFVDPYQVKLAAHQGADAILLMLSVLDDQQYQMLATEAKKYQLDMLTEVSDQTELERAIALGAEIIGINNRNLRDLSTDLTTTEELAPQIPSDRVIVSESGIYNQAQVRRLSPLVDGFLVGSSLMAEADLDLACRTLTFGHNKVCGLTRVEDAIACAETGAVYGGLIFVEKSPRYISPKQALALVNHQREAGKALKFVGVFVNTNVHEIVKIATSLQLFAVQLHGDESTETITALRQGLTTAACNCEIWKAIAVADDVLSSAIPNNVDRLMFDSKTNKQFGGTGETFDWQVTLPNKQTAMLAGGLNPQNAFDAAKQGFYGLDFNSGVESSAGIKDKQKIQQVFTALRRY